MPWPCRKIAPPAAAAAAIMSKGVAFELLHVSLLSACAMFGWCPSETGNSKDRRIDVVVVVPQQHNGIAVLLAVRENVQDVFSFGSGMTTGFSLGKAVLENFRDIF